MNITKQNKIEINIQPLSVQAKNAIKAKTNYSYSLYTTILYILIISIMFIIFIAYVNDVDFFVQMKTYNNIVNNINNFGSLVKQITIQQAALNKQRFFGKYSLLSQYKCYDMGTYYVAALLDSSFLPTFIRRGSGDIWRVNKAATIDLPASQFCLYLISQYNDNNLQCGNDYYAKLGISGYLEGQLNDCNIITDKMYTLINA
jgi:competence protein ComGC